MWVADQVDGIYGGAFEGRVFVLTHRPPEGKADPRIGFVPDGIEAAVADAGGELTRQCLRAGLGRARARLDR